jgi:hypothetical protein
MTPDQTSLEAELRELQAAALDEALLLRLEAAADGDLTRLSHEEIRFEAFLREIQPAALSNDFLTSLDTVVHEVPFSMDDKVVLFPKAGAVSKPRQPRPMWGAAAAVALFGAITALMIPAAKPPTTLANGTTPGSKTVKSNAAANFVPASFNRGLSEVRDEGVVWKSNQQPHSVVRVVYMDIITLKDANGRTAQVEQPRVEYLLVPAKTD